MAKRYDSYLYPHTCPGPCPDPWPNPCPPCPGPGPNPDPDPDPDPDPGPEPELSGRGTLELRSFAARESGPIANATVHIYGAGVDVTVTTDADGIGPDISIPAPSRAWSLDENNTTVQPYSTITLHATAEGYLPITVEGVQIFDGQTSLAQMEFTPAESGIAIINEDETVIPPHHLFVPGGASGAAPLSNCVPRILDQPIIPDYVTVHLGRPSASARNVTVTFRYYIANVASSEVYPTWPEQALRANIHAQISLALNRIYTEWYPSKGYTFNITNSTSYDQYYVQGREIFKVMQDITDDIFNTYVRRPGTIDPYYTEYCDGKTVSCKGMKQWGTVTLANQGMNALNILKYYYGNNLEIVRTNRIQSIPQSYPGSPLRVGSTGTAVSTIQRQLNRIAKNYPFFGTVNVDGVFGESTAEVVRKFQKQFSLTQDGVVGRNTWYKISYIYVAVKKLAELTSEGEQDTGSLIDGVYPGTSLRQGSTGAAVEQVQFWLNTLAEFNDDLQGVTVDGVFGSGTAAAVRTFQSQNGLVADGIVGRDTWNAIYAQFSSLESDITDGPAGAYPGTPLRLGDTGNNVQLAQFYLRVISTNYSSIPSIAVDGTFGSGTQAAVRAFQSFFGLSVDGVIGPATWNKMYEVYTDVANDLLAPDQRPGTYPGTVLRRGSTGKAVRELQYYLFILSAYYRQIPQIAFDGVFGAGTEAAVRAYQQLAGLTVDGLVGPATWNSIYAQFQKLRLSGPVLSYDVVRWPGEVFKYNSQGPYVEYIQFLLQYIGFFYPTVQQPEIDGNYYELTEAAVRGFQTTFELPVTGEVDELTWNRMIIVYLYLASRSPESRNTPTGEYPGYVLALGSAGPAVLELQGYMNEIANRYCIALFTPENGIYDEQMEAAVKAFQKGFGIPETGVTDRETWDSIVAVWRQDTEETTTQLY